MKMHIREFAKLTGVSVSTLHYYDEIGLLKPYYVDEQNGYRSYDERSLERMQEILFYRELDFPLKSIAEILSSPNYNKRKALTEQKKLLLITTNRNIYKTTVYLYIHGGFVYENNCNIVRFML